MALEHSDRGSCTHCSSGSHRSDGVRRSSAATLHAEQHGHDIKMVYPLGGQQAIGVGKFSTIVTFWPELGLWRHVH